MNSSEDQPPVFLHLQRQNLINFKNRSSLYKLDQLSQEEQSRLHREILFKKY